MRKILRKILEILDGTPAVYKNQNRWRGQSVVELALVTPILIVLLMGLAEIGWFANNFLILLEVTRVGARLGTSLNGTNSPLVWNNDGSRFPNEIFKDTPPNAIRYRQCDEIAQHNDLQGFYNFIGCKMIQQMDPLQMDIHNNVDDIIISAFSLLAVDPDCTRVPRDPSATVPCPAFYANGTQSGPSPGDMIKNSLDQGLGNNKQIIVIGRYPTNANECTVDKNGNPKVWERDPFDYFQDGGARDYQILNPAAANPQAEDNKNYVELAGYDAPSYQPFTNPPGSPSQPAAVPERQRGWAFFGQHGMSDAFDPATGTKHCLGSEWSMDKVQKLMNVPSFGLANEERQRLPSQGMVLVELYWQHELLLKNPVFNPVWTILGDNTIISVWAAFPLPATEPHITFR